MICALLAVHKKMASLASSATVGQGDKQKQQLIGCFRERAPLFINVLDKEQPCLIFLRCFLSYNLVDRKAVTGFCVTFKHYNFFWPLLLPFSLNSSPPCCCCHGDPWMHKSASEVLCKRNARFPDSHSEL